MNDSPTRAEGIEINEVADGYVVYQPDRERVHYLNATAAIVLQLCDGRTPAGSMPQTLQEAYGLPDRPTTEVTECLETLFEEGLIE